MSSWSKTCTLDAERRCAQSREKAANSMLRLTYTRDLPVPLPHTDGRADGKGEEGSPIVDAVCLGHRVVWRQGCGHDRVPGVVEESLGREGNAGQ